MTRLPTAALLAAAVLSGSAASAQTLSVAPAPGLWETQGRMSVNGQDIGALMRQSMQAALKDMPADRRAMAEQMMKAQGMPGADGRRQECLTPAEAARRADPRAVLEGLQKDSPECRYEPVQVRGATLAFKGRCDDPDGFSGDVTGELTMDGPKAWTGRWGGVGRMSGAEQMPGLKVQPDGRTQFGWSGSGRWVAASCGSVKPR